MRSLLFVVLLLSCFALSACSTYRNGFICPDSKGADCVALSKVDQMVDSGEIETVYMDKKGRSCRKCVMTKSTRVKNDEVR